MSRKVRVDLTGVESYTRCPEGEWLARLKKIDVGEVQGSGDDALKAQFEVIKGEAKGNSVFETFSLSEKALWKLKSFLDAVGMKSDGKLNLDLDKMEGKICIIEVIHDEYNGVKRAKINSYIKPTSEGDDDDEEDTDEEELDDEEEEEKPAKKSKKAPVKSSKKKPEPEEEDEDDDEDEEEEEEEEEEPPRKSKKAAAKPSKKASKKSSKKDDDEDDWEDDD